jgi:hypothetical protein
MNTQAFKFFKNGKYSLVSLNQQICMHHYHVKMRPSQLQWIGNTRIILNKNLVLHTVKLHKQHFSISQRSNALPPVIWIGIIAKYGAKIGSVLGGRFVETQLLFT